jgi:rhodanese-related sulfurtransferase
MRLKSGGIAMLDVREPGERENARVEGTLAIPLAQLEARMHELPTTGPLAVHCAGGYRSTIACSLLQRAGRAQLVDVRGGMAGWEQCGLPTLRGTASCGA